MAGLLHRMKKDQSFQAGLVKVTITQTKNNEVTCLIEAPRDVKIECEAVGKSDEPQADGGV